MKKKLVFYLGGSNFSGAEKRIFLTALHISKMNLFEVVLFIRHDLFESIKKHDKFSGYDISSLDVKLEPTFGTNKVTKYFSVALKYSKRLIYFCLARPDIAHFTLYNFLDLHFARVIKLLGGKVLFEVTSPDVASTTETKKLISNKYICDALVCVSQNVRSVCLSSDTKNKERILLRKNPFVDIDRQPYTFNDKKNQVLFAHRLIQRKNPLLALSAFTQLARKHPEWQFVICGRGDLEYTISQMVESLNLPNLTFTGYEVNMRARLKESKIFVSLIEPDNYPSQSVIEAMASGCALILSNTGQSEEKFLSDNRTNGFALKLDCKTIIEAIDIMIKSERVDEMCQNSFIHFNDAFSFDAYLHETLTLILGACHGHSTPSENVPEY